MCHAPTHINFFPCKPCNRFGPSRGAIMNARIRSARGICLGATEGMGISSFLLGTPGRFAFSSLISSGLYLTFFACLFLPFDILRRGCVDSSRDSRSLIRKGSSSSASWSTRSPVSDADQRLKSSESLESSNESRAPWARFSFGDSISDALSESRCLPVDKEWRGIFADIREFDGGGMMAV